MSYLVPPSPHVYVHAVAPRVVCRTGPCYHQSRDRGRGALRPVGHTPSLAGWNTGRVVQGGIRADKYEKHWPHMHTGMHICTHAYMHA